jgi:gas vesicle protein
MNNKTKRIAIGTLIAGTVGYVAGILTAPKSGKETREDLNKLRVRTMAEAEKELKKLHTELNELLGEVEKKGAVATARERGGPLAKDAVEKATVVRQKTREIITAIHDGSAEDKDLDKAIAEAGKAISSIKAFLKK